MFIKRETLFNKKSGISRFLPVQNDSSERRENFVLMLSAR